MHKMIQAKNSGKSRYGHLFSVVFQVVLLSSNDASGLISLSKHQR